MADLHTDLPGRLAQTQQLITTLTYRSVDPEGRYGVVSEDQARTRPPGPQWHHIDGGGVQVTRTTDENGETTTGVAILSRSTTWSHLAPIGVLVDSPDDVQDFLEQYAPEVMQHYEAWERGELVER